MARRARRTMGNRLQSLSVSRLHLQSCAIFSDIRSWHSKGKLYEAPEACFDYVSEKDLCKMIGNSVPVPLIGEIMQEAMFAAGLISEKKQFLASQFQLDWLHRPAWLLRPKSNSSSRLTWGRVKKRCFKDPIFWLAFPGLTVFDIYFTYTCYQSEVPCSFKNYRRHVNAK